MNPNDNIAVLLVLLPWVEMLSLIVLILVLGRAFFVLGNLNKWLKQKVK